MLHVKKGHISLCIGATNRVGDVVVALDIAVKCSAGILKSLKCGTPCMCSVNDKKESCCCCPEGCEETMVCWALAHAVDQKLAGSPLEVFKSRVGNVNCSYCCGNFTISWHTQGTVSAVRKSIGLALSALDPAKMFSAYQQAARCLQRSTSREDFNYAADKVAAAINKGVTICVSGRIKVDKEKAEAVLAVIEKKLPKSKVDGKKTKPSQHTKCESDCCELKCDSWACALVRDYVAAKLKGVCLNGGDHGVCLGVKSSRLEPLSAKLKSGVKEYVAAKYGKVRDDLHPILAYMILSGGAAGAQDACELLHKKPSVSDIEKAIAKVF